MFFAETDLSLELLGVFMLERKGGTQQSNEIRNHDSISIRLSGQGTIRYEDTQITAEQGDVLYIPANVQYSQSTPGEVTLMVHFINYSYILNKDNHPCIIRVEDVEKIENCFREMYDTWKEKKHSYRYRCTALLHELLYHLSLSAATQGLGKPHTDRDIERAANYIHHHFRSNSIEVQELAKMSNMSESNFRKLFKTVYGVSPKQYIMNLQLESASQLLRSRLYTVAEAGERSGFSDTKYFSRVFKQHFGVSPKEYQNANPEDLLKQ